MIALNLNHAVLSRPARSAQTLEGFGGLFQVSLGKAGNDADDACAPAFAHHAHDAVVRNAVLHGRAVRQARALTPPNARRMMDRRVAIFCGAHTGNGSRYIEIAETVAQRIVQRNFGIVYGGGRVGLMGVIADTALQAGGEVVGVIPQALASEEIAHGGLTQLHVVASMHERKALMADLSDGFIALPGGFGTMDEFCEILTWAQLRIHANPVGLLNPDGYYDELLALFDKMVAQAFVTPTNRALVRSAPNIDALLEIMFAH
jgi:uncharacterized protein (TIGR00730 family)